MIKSTFLLLIACVLSQGTVCAQYEGDAGSGAKSLALNGSNCSQFLGGNNSGYSSSYFSYSILCQSYLGGDNSGQSSTFFLYSVLCQSYKGGDYSGQTVGTFTNPYSCTQFTATATGGSGHDARSLSEDLGGCTILALPIDGSPLFGEIENRKGYLHWETYSEVNNQGFKILKSVDGVNWETIGWVDGATNSSSQLSYNFTDEHLSEGNNYYRYQQVDMDGESSFSNIVTLNLEHVQTLKNLFVVYPNPLGSSELLQIRSWTTKDLEVELIIKDGVGRILQKELFGFSSGQQTHQLPVNFTSGNYYLTVTTIADGATIILPFVIQ